MAKSCLESAFVSVHDERMAEHHRYVLDDGSVSYELIFTLETYRCGLKGPQTAESIGEDRIV